MQDCAAQHLCSQDFQESPDSLGPTQPTAAPCLCGGSRLWGHTRDPRGAAHQRYCAHCSWAASRTWGSSSLLPCRGPQWHHLNYLFGLFHAPFQEALWKLLINGQIFFPKTGVSGVMSMTLPRRGALMALSSTSILCNTLLMQDEGHHWSTPSSPWTILWWPMWSWWETPWLCKGFRPPFVISLVTA